MGGKTVHVFTASGVFNNTTGSPITGGVFLVVGGGGAGSGTNESSDGSAGGGAGGVLSNHGDVPGSLQVGFAAIGTAHIQLLLVPVVLRAHLEHPPIHSLMDRLELVLLLEPQLQHLAVVEVLLVQVKMVKMVDLVVVHQVADQLEMVV